MIITATASTIYDKELFKGRAELIYTSVTSVYEEIERGCRITGVLHLNTRVGKAAFDTEDPIFFDYVRCIEEMPVHLSGKIIHVVEIYTYDDEFWQFRLL